MLLFLNKRYMKQRTRTQNLFKRQKKKKRKFPVKIINKTLKKLINLPKNKEGDKCK